MKQSLFREEKKNVICIMFMGGTFFFRNRFFSTPPVCAKTCPALIGFLSEVILGQVLNSFMIECLRHPPTTPIPHYHHRSQAHPQPHSFYRMMLYSAVCTGALFPADYNLIPLKHTCLLIFYWIEHSPLSSLAVDVCQILL